MSSAMAVKTAMEGQKVETVFFCFGGGAGGYLVYKGVWGVGARKIQHIPSMKLRWQGKIDPWMRYCMFLLTLGVTNC